MDMIKAFDTVRHSLLFKKLIEQGLPSGIVRFLLIAYKLQVANVKCNGVKQGAVLSAVLNCVNTIDLFKELCRLNIGCCIGQNYVGIIGHADDLLLKCQ